MNDAPWYVQLVIQAGALGLCVLMLVYVGKKLDRLADAFNNLASKIEVMLDREDYRRVG